MTEIEECLTCGDTFVQDPHPMNHSFYCDNCGDPREGEVPDMETHYRNKAIWEWID